MKKITEIQIENYRAFYGKYDPILLPKGENLLLYGENGSGKSSLFKALNDFFASSRINDLSYTRNHHSPSIPGLVKIVFSNLDGRTFEPIAGTEQELSFGTAGSTNAIQFVQDADLIKGFLDYRKLLEVYNHKDERPNLFNLIVTELLRDFIPSGSTFPIGEKWLQLVDTLYNVRTRNAIIHKQALAELPTYQAILDDSLKKIFQRLNFFLIKYFRLNLRVRYILSDIEYNYTPDWQPTADLRLSLMLNGKEMQSEFLNEARLSALAVCLYLSSILQNPKEFDYKVLFLDDVFIGLDSGNRIPIAKILKNHFMDYQIFITTYDRNWFELAQRFEEGNDHGKWKSYELYATSEEFDGIKFEKPLLLPYEENFDRGVYYLHHKTKPDYPASANYFRKYAEDILINHLPPHELRNEDYSFIESYRLSKLVKEGILFLNKIRLDSSKMNQLKNFLPTLLHPLSHYDLSSSIYKSELIDIQKILRDLKNHLVEIKKNYQLLLPSGRMFKLKLTISPLLSGYYEIYTSESIYILKNSAGLISLSSGRCQCKRTYILNGTVTDSQVNFSNNDPKANFTSIENSYDRIYSFISTQPQYSHIPKASDYKTEFILPDGSSWQTIDHFANSFTW